MSTPDPLTIEQVLDRRRAELGVAGAFPAEVLAEAEAAARRDPTAGPARADRTDVPFVTIDPPGSRDLDQALHLERAGEGWRVRYAIADVGFFVDRGGAVEREAWRRGLTFYAPDRKTPLYPEALSQGAASLLPDRLRPAILFTFDLDAGGERTAKHVERALVRSRAQLTYGQVTEHVERGGAGFRGEPWADVLPLLKEVGQARRRREEARGGVSLPLLEQHVQRDAAAKLGYALAYEQPVEAEEWNAQVSLLTGNACAEWMIAGGIGLLRAMPPLEEERVQVFRKIAHTLGFDWPRGMGYGTFVRSLDPRARNVAPLLWQARRVMRGSDYVAFRGAPPPEHLHSALAMPYAHATAPLRRLCDRYVLELVLAQVEQRPVPPGEFGLLERLAGVMNDIESREKKLERAAVDIAEAWTLQEREGERFAATVLGVRDGRAEVQIESPPVRVEAARGPGVGFLELGRRVVVRLAGVRVEEGKLEFVVEAEAPA